MQKDNKKLSSESYLADKAVKGKENDRFQRYGFSKRIAETIKSRHNSECLVMGIYGAWGEGKSSVLNFIQEELEEDDSCIILELNPWRYADEDSILYNMFDKIAKSLEQSLKTKKEKVKDVVKGIGELGKTFGVDGTGVIKMLRDAQLEDLKDRIDGFLKESDKHLVIFIDDIDRLDKDEIFALFRIVKLTADFSNTTYVLAFDPEMVGEAISRRYSGDEPNAGEKFLEKIIQVPLVIPKVQPETLKKYCFGLLDDFFNNKGLELTEDDTNRFAYQFSENIAFRLTTPRLAVRYTNSITFSIPLLWGEVNIVDLMLIEAIKNFYPLTYQAIKENPDYFIGTYRSPGYGSSNKEGKIKRLKKLIEDCSTDLKEHEKDKHRELLMELFPSLKSAFMNYHFSNDHYHKWRSKKCISIGGYFERYFSYSVLEGDISDVQFSQFLELLKEKSIEDVTVEATVMIRKSDMFKFISKLQQNKDELDWKRLVKLMSLVCQLSSHLEKSGSIFGAGFDTSFKQAAIFIFSVFDKHKDRDDLVKTALELLEKTETIEFAYEVLYWLAKKNDHDQTIFSDSEFSKLEKVIVVRTENQIDPPFFIKHPEINVRLLFLWKRHRKTRLSKLISDYLKRDEKNIIVFMTTFLPLIRSSARKDRYLGSMKQGNYDNLISFIKPNSVLRRCLKIHSRQILDNEPANWEREDYGEYDEVNMIRQFEHWYKKGKQNSD